MHVSNRGVNSLSDKGEQPPRFPLLGYCSCDSAAEGVTSQSDWIDMQSKFVSNQVRVQSELYLIGKYYLIVNMQSRQSPKMQNCGNRKCAQPVRI